MLRPYRIVVIGHSLADLKEKMLAFVNELDGNVDAPKAASPVESPFAAPPPIPHISAQTEQASNPMPSFVFRPPETSAPKTTVASYGLDAKGMPWDERIHSNTQGKNKDGSWRYRRGVTDPEIEAVEAELNPNKVAPKAPSPIVQTPLISPIVQTPLMTQAAPPVVASPAPALAVVPPLQSNPPVAQPAPALPAAYTLESFTANLVPAMASLVQEGKLTQDYVEQLKKHFGCQIWDFKPEQIKEMFEQFVAHGLIAKA